MTPEETTQADRLTRVLTFLKTLHAMQSPPVRSVGKHGKFRVQDRDIVDLPGITHAIGDTATLTVENLPRPVPPAVPDDLQGLLDRPIGTVQHPELTLAAQDEDTEGKLQDVLDRWIPVCQGDVRHLV